MQRVSFQFVLVYLTHDIKALLFDVAFQWIDKGTLKLMVCHGFLKPVHGLCVKLRDDSFVEFFKPFQIGFIGERDIDKVGGEVRFFPINTRNIGPYKKGFILVLYFTKKTNHWAEFYFHSEDDLIFKKALFCCKRAVSLILPMDFTPHPFSWRPKLTL
jgi:hypothetical protein